jgi:hypothetical protein
MISFLRTGALALLLVVALAHETALSQNTCPSGFPVNCNNGRCCPANTWCVAEGGCVPNGWSYCGGGKTCPPGKPVACPRLGKCFAGSGDAQQAGCSFAEQKVCGVPVR